MNEAKEKAADIAALESNMNKLVFLAYEQYKLMAYQVLGNTPIADKAIEEFNRKFAEIN